MRRRPRRGRGRGGGPGSMPPASARRPRARRLPHPARSRRRAPTPASAPSRGYRGRSGPAGAGPRRRSPQRGRARRRAPRSARCRRRPAPRRCRRACRGAGSALAELRTLAGLLQPRLTPFLDPRVARQQPPSLELAAEIGVDLGQRPGDAVADRPRLARDAAAVDPDPDIDRLLVAAGDERLAGERLQVRTGEVVVEAAAVDLELTATGSHEDPGDGALALTGRLDQALGLELYPGLVRRERLLGSLGGRLGLDPRPLLGLSLDPRPLLGAELALGLERDRIELGARGKIGSR